MNTVKLVALSVVVFLLFFAGCMVSITVDQSSVAQVEPSLIRLISAAVLGIYEVVVRVIPSVGDYSVISRVIQLMKRLSDVLNVRKE